MDQQSEDVRQIIEILKPPRTETTASSKTPKAHYTKTTSPTIQQLMQGEATSWSPHSSPKLSKNLDHEEHHKKSVLTKVKEKAKKLRHSLSGRKHHDEHDQLPGGIDSSPSCRVHLEDDKCEEEDPEFLGAPIYESEKAPETFKHTLNHHPREVHELLSDKHMVVSSNPKPGGEEDPEFLGAPMYESEKAPESYKQTLSYHPREVHELPSEKHLIPTSGTKSGDEHWNDKPLVYPSSNTTTEKQAPVSETLSEKISPKYAAVSAAAQNIASKISNLTVSAPQGTEAGVHSGSPQTWDKGVSVKEYLMQKFEPGEDERALSQVISESISPRGNMGVVDKMKGAVSSFIWTEDLSNATTKSSADASIVSNNNMSSPIIISTTRSSSSTANKTPVPVAASPYEAIEEENHGRILQAN